MLKALLDQAYHPLVDQVAQIGCQQLAPRAAVWDRENRFAFEAMEALRSAQLFGLTVEAEWGGHGRDLLALAVLIEGLARYDGGTALTIAAHSLVCDHLLLHGSLAQQQRYLRPLAAGQMLGAWALAEGGSGSDAASIRSRAERVPQGWLLNGRKMFVTNGAVAGVYVVLARTGKSAISAFLVDPSQPGVKASKPLAKMGCRSSNTTAVRLDDVLVPQDSLLGELDGGLKAALGLLDRGRVTIAALACGLQRACIEDSRQHALRRRQFNQPLAGFQAIQWKLAEMATRYDASWLLTAQAAARGCPAGAAGSSAAKAKLFASRAAVEGADEAIQIHGGYGYLKNLPVERYLRDAKLTEIGEGTSEVQKLVIARDLLQAN